MIYKMNSKKIRQLLLDFSSTYYGRTMFLLCYGLFFVVFGSTITAFIVHIFHKNIFTGLFVIIGTLISVITFITGSIIYYKELRIYADNR